VKDGIAKVSDMGMRLKDKEQETQILMREKHSLMEKLALEERERIQNSIYAKVTPEEL
jgi:hypothetical protein